MKALIVAAAAALALIAAPTATAASADLGGGSTTLKLDSGLVEALTDADVALAPVSPATARKGGRVAFPITGGELDPKTAAGVITHSGGLSIRAGKTTVSLTNFRIKVGKRVSLSARVGDARLKILDLSLAKAKVSRKGFALKVKGVRAYLSRDAARALNKAFKTRPVQARHQGRHRIGLGHVRRGDPGQGLHHARPRRGRCVGAELARRVRRPDLPARARSTGLAFPITGGKVNLSTLVARSPTAAGSL